VGPGAPQSLAAKAETVYSYHWGRTFWGVKYKRETVNDRESTSTKTLKQNRMNRDHKDSPFSEPGKNKKYRGAFRGLK